MPHDDEACSDLFGNPRDFVSGGADAQARRRRKAHGLEPLHALGKDFLVGFDLIVDRDRDTALQRRAEGRFHNSQQEDFGAAELRELRALPQRPPSFNRAVIGEKNFLVQE